MSTEGYIMKGSLIEPFKECRPSIEMPVVLYLHGNSSSRIEGLNIAGELLKRDINLFVIDFVGCGLSEGEYISLGYHESDDVGNVIDFIEKIPGVGRIGLWGRSMGAATTMIYAHRDERIKAICMDSPFADFIRLAKELTLKQINLPGFLINTVLNIIRKTILGKNGLDIDKLKPIDSASKTFQPAIFIHAIYDELINVNHSIDLFNKYGGQVKSLKCCDKGGHNSKRNSMIINEIGNFFEENLKKGINDKNNQIDNKIKDNLNKNEIEEFNSKEILKKNSLKEDIFNESEEPFNNIEYKIKKEEKFKKQINELEATLKSMKNIKKKNIDMNSTCYDSLNEEEKEN
jgi:pimeloyl-ACP methyl ester carboxylesterase